MDANLRFWRAEGQRFLLWADVLDPLLLLKSSDEIRRTRLLLQNSGKTLSEPIQNGQMKQAFLLSLSSVHPDTDKIIPVLFRPPAFLPISLPLLNALSQMWLDSVLALIIKVIASSLQLRATQTFFCQFVFHTYTTGFTLLNGNGTTKAEEYSLQQKQMFYSLGAISYAACIGALPLVFMNRHTLKSSLTQLVVKKLLPAPLLGLMTAFTVAVARSPEFENGIEVMDRNGKVVGVSQKAGEKAVKETALSRAVLFGTAFFLPAVLMYFVERLFFEPKLTYILFNVLDRAKFAKTPHALASVRMLMITSVLAGMLPVSLSIFPQCGECNKDKLNINEGTWEKCAESMAGWFPLSFPILSPQQKFSWIKRADLEPEILSSTEETELFYNRGI